MTNLLLKLFVKDYRNTKDVKVREKYGLLGSFFGLITNFLLFLAKIIIGLMMNLFSIVADSVNNLSDFGNNGLSILGFKVSSKKADSDHPFGHQRMEYIISLVISCVIIALGFVMFYQGIVDLIAFINSMMEFHHPVIQELSNIEFIATIVILALAVLAKVAQASLYFSLAKRIDSLQLKAVGRDSLNDVIGTTLVIVGVLITKFTTYSVDCFFTLVVAGLVIYSGIGILKQAADILIGKKADKEIIVALINLIKSHKGALGIHDLTMHYYGNNIFAVIHVEVAASKNILESHSLCDDIEKEAYEKLHIHLTIHMDPVLLNDPDTEKYKNEVSLAIKKLPYPITFHDFRIVSGVEHVNLVFDVVMPSEHDDEKGRKEVYDTILKECDMKYGKKVYPVINFDDSSTDFLYGTEVEQ